MSSITDFFGDVLDKGLPATIDGVFGTDRTEEQYAEKAPPQDAAPASKLVPTGIPPWMIYAGGAVLTAGVLYLLVRK